MPKVNTKRVEKITLSYNDGSTIVLNPDYDLLIAQYRGMKDVAPFNYGGFVESEHNDRTVMYLLSAPKDMVTRLESILDMEIKQRIDT